MKKITFRMNELYADAFFVNDGNDISSKKIVIYLSGMPGTMGKNEGTLFFAKKGFFVIQPQYFGTYDSGRTFNPENVFKTVHTLNEIVENGFIIDIKNSNYVRISNEISIAFGHSFGCFVLLSTLNFLPKLKVVILFAPLIGFGNLYGSNTDPISQIQYLKQARIYTYRIKSTKTWEKYFLNELSQKDRKNPFSSAKDTSVLVIVGSKDSSFNTNALKEIVKIYGFPEGKKVADFIEVNAGDHDIGSLLNKKVKNSICKLL